VSFAEDFPLADVGTGGFAFGKFENLAHFGKTDGFFATEWLEQALHGFANLIDEFVNHGVKFDLHVFGFDGFDGLAFDFDIEADDVRDALSALAKQHTEERLTQVGMVQKFLITEVKNYNLEEY
jgi:hypothetical protein